MPLPSTTSTKRGGAQECPLAAVVVVMLVTVHSMLGWSRSINFQQYMLEFYYNCSGKISYLYFHTKFFSVLSAESDYIYWIDSGISITRSKRDLTERKTLVTGLMAARDLAIDPQGGETLLFANISL